MYSRHISLPEYLDSLGPDIGLLRLPWKMFGSSGYVSRPLLGLLQSMVWWRGFEKTRMNVHTKCIFRGAAVAGSTLGGLGVHDVEIKPGYVAGFPYTRGSVSPAVEEVDGKELSRRGGVGTHGAAHQPQPGAVARLVYGGKGDARDRGPGRQRLQRGLLQRV